MENDIVECVLDGAQCGMGTLMCTAMVCFTAYVVAGALRPLSAWFGQEVHATVSLHGKQTGEPWKVGLDWTRDPFEHEGYDIKQASLVLGWGICGLLGDGSLRCWDEQGYLHDHFQKRTKRDPNVVPNAT